MSWWTGRTWPPRAEPRQASGSSKRRSVRTRPKIPGRASSWSSMRPSSTAYRGRGEAGPGAMLNGEVVSPPAGAIGRGDAFVLRIAERTGAVVLSNDSFQEFHGEHPWLFDEGRLVGGKPVPGVGWIFTPDYQCADLRAGWPRPRPGPREGPGFRPGQGGRAGGRRRRRPSGRQGQEGGRRRRRGPSTSWPAPRSRLRARPRSNRGFSSAIEEAGRGGAPSRPQPTK